jgi:hypothetical protein
MGRTARDIGERKRDATTGTTYGIWISRNAPIGTGGTSGGS